MDKKHAPATFISGSGRTTINLELKPTFDLSPENFNSPNAFLHHLADLTGLEDLKRRAEAGEGAWITNVERQFEVGAVTVTDITLAMARRPAPQQEAINAAVRAAQISPCQKSKRGAVVFQPFNGRVCTPACNHRPDGPCDSLCRPGVPSRIGRSTCAQLAIHAEHAAILHAVAEEMAAAYVADGDLAFRVRDCEMVHAKVDDRGHLVPSGGPSCLECAKAIMDVKLQGVWLYETTHVNSLDGAVAEWVFYPTRRFWELTLQTVKL